METDSSNFKFKLFLNEKNKWKSIFPSNYSLQPKKSNILMHKNNINLKWKIKGFRIINNIKKFECSFPFLKPVNPLLLNIPDYFDIISNPMDLSTVENNLKNHIYKNHEEFNKDMLLIWYNAKLYNNILCDVHYYATILEQVYIKEYTYEFNKGKEKTNFNLSLYRNSESIKVKYINDNINLLNSDELLDILDIIYDGKPYEIYNNFFKINDLNKDKINRIYNIIKKGIENKIITKDEQSLKKFFNKKFISNNINISEEENFFMEDSDSFL